MDATVCFMRVVYIVILALVMIIQSIEGDSISINLHYTSYIDESEYMHSIYGRNVCLSEGGICVEYPTSIHVSYYIFTTPLIYTKEH